MSAPLRVYQQVQAQIKRCAPDLRITSVRRVATLVVGIAASEACSLRRVGRRVRTMGVSRAQPESIARRLRRTVAAVRLASGAGYAALLAEAIAWPADTPVPLVLDESATPGGLHVLRLSLAYRGRCMPLAWAVWPHQQKLAPGAYWRFLEGVLARADALLPPGVRVVLLADRAYDIPPRARPPRAASCPPTAAAPPRPAARSCAGRPAPPRCLPSRAARPLARSPAGCGCTR